MKDKERKVVLIDAAALSLLLGSAEGVVGAADVLHLTGSQLEALQIAVKLGQLALGQLSDEQIARAVRDAAEARYALGEGVKE